MEGVFAEAVEVEVDVVPGLRVRVLEASVDWQERLIEAAVEALDDQNSIETDPYGVALWPAAQVLAQAVAAHLALSRELQVLELGAGCGLVSLAAAALGAEVLATDFRELPLALLGESARRQGLAKALQTRLFDVRSGSARLPPADLVVASDVLYERSTAVAFASRVAEARERGSTVLISDIGRPNRAAFLEELQRLRPKEHAEFAVVGLAVQVARTGPGEEAPARKEVRVEVLELPPAGPASSALLGAGPCVLVRPAHHGHVL